MKRHWLSLCAAFLTLALTGCEITRNIAFNYDISANTNSGLVLFSVTHDKDNEHLFRYGANVNLSIYFRDVAKGSNIPWPFSSMAMFSLKGRLRSSNVWGRVFVREFEVGHYELSGWDLSQYTGVGEPRSLSPKQPPPPITFEVQPGSVTYIGNVHGALIWGKNIFGIDLVAGAIPQIRNEAERDVTMILKDYPQLEGKIVVAPLRTGPWLAE